MIKNFGFMPRPLNTKKYNNFQHIPALGFTIIEIMVVIFIFALIFLAILGVFTIGQQSWYTGATQVEMQQLTRRAMDWMTRELREANASVVSISGGNTITFQVPVDWDGDGDFTDDSGAVEWGANDGTSDRLGWKIQYTLSSAQLLRKILNSGSTEQESLRKVLATDTSALSFSYDSVSRIIIQITSQKDAILGQTVQSNLQSQVALRN